MRHGENRNRIVDLACLVDVFGRIGISPTTFTGPSKKGSKVTDRRVAARGFLVFGEMFADLFIGDLVKIYFGRKSFGQEAQERVIADNSLLRCAAISLGRQEALDGIRQGNRGGFRPKAFQTQFHRMREREACPFELPKARDRDATNSGRDCSHLGATLEIFGPPDRRLRRL